MQKHLLPLLLTLTLCANAKNAEITVHIQDGEGQIIPAEIYGQFSEHLGRCIYGGIWVGEDSPIPNTHGYRTDVLNALRELQVPVLRWPGGCFADDYHWQDGIGPRDQRTLICNNNWGGDLEDNSFGTHEFLDFCELIGAEPYISGNVGSGTPEELSKWVEYMTSDSRSTVVEQRRRNGRDKSWNVRYLGIGNEAWGCGGNMTPEYYSDLFRRYTTYTRNYNGRLYKIASGASDIDYNWTEVLMRNIGTRMDALAVHYYTVPENWDHHGSATDFSAADYWVTLRKAVALDTIIQRHIAIMDQYDPERKIDLLVDEWGTWYDVEPGTNPGHLYQQSTMRDAMVAALSLNIFHKYSYRVKMANIAQVVNVLQSMILTDSTSLVLTPTYHVFHMYNVHRNAEFLPCSIMTSDAPRKVSGADEEAVPEIDITASRKDGLTHLTLANPSLTEDKEVRICGLQSKVLAAEILTAAKVYTVNTFDHPERVKPNSFSGFRFSRNKQTGRMELLVTLPKCSIVSLELD